MFEGNDNGQDLHDVSNTLYGEMSLSKTPCSQTDLSEMSTGHMDEVVTSAVVRHGYPYETPAPHGTFDGGSD